MATTHILLPGMDGTGELFAPLLEQISADYRVVVVAYPPNELLGYEELYQRYIDPIDERDPVVLIAESFSSPLAIRYAAANAGRVRALVLCASFARFHVPPIVRSLVRAFAGIRPPAALLRWFLAGRAPRRLVHQLKHAIRQVDPRVMARRVAEVSRVDVRDDLRCLALPILYLAAAQDRLVPAGAHREMQAIVPNLIVRTIDAPHLLLQTAPAEAWREIEAFLADV